MSGRRWAALVGAALCLAAAHDPSDQLRDPRQEARARALFQETRCLVCQGESIDDSDADLAGDLRGAIRAQVAAGRTDDQVRDYLSTRYGDFVLFRPRFGGANALLWGGPFLVAALGAVLLFRRQRTMIAAPALSTEEEASLTALSAEERS